MRADTPCSDGHTWTNPFDDWTPQHGTPCDCGKKEWGVPIVVAREHEWEFYGDSGSICKRCGARIGSGQICR